MDYHEFIARLLPMLNFIASSIWTRLFGHQAELLKGRRFGVFTSGL